MLVKAFAVTLLTLHGAACVSAVFITGKQLNRLSDEQQAEAIARQATRDELRRHGWITPEEERRLTLGCGLNGGNYDFMLYIPAERPLDSVVLAHTVVNGRTGEASVTVNLPRKAAGTG